MKEAANCSVAGPRHAKKLLHDGGRSAREAAYYLNSTPNLCVSFHTALQVRFIELPSIRRSKLSGMPNVLPIQRPAPPSDILMTVHLIGGRLDATIIIAGC